MKKTRSLLLCPHPKFLRVFREAFFKKFPEWGLGQSPKTVLPKTVLPKTVLPHTAAPNGAAILFFKLSYKFIKTI